MNFLLWVTTAVIRWIRLKIYQYEVTFAVYMLTPTEKFIFSMPLSPTSKSQTRWRVANGTCRLPPPLPRLHDRNRRLHLPPQSHSHRLRPSILLLGWRPDLPLVQSALYHLCLSGVRDAKARGDVRRGEEHCYHDDGVDSRVVIAYFLQTLLFDGGCFVFLDGWIARTRA